MRCYFKHRKINFLCPCLLLLVHCSSNNQPSANNDQRIPDGAPRDGITIGDYANQDFSAADGLSQADGRNLKSDTKSTDSNTVASCEETCLNAAPYNKCVIVEGTCEECLEDIHCQINPGALGPKCDQETYSCVCGSDQDCASNQRGKHCVGEPLPMCQCEDDKECKAPFTVCSAAYGPPLVCTVPCTEDDACQYKYAPFCQKTTGKCVECMGNIHCPDAYPICDLAKNECRKCTGNPDCEDHLYGPVCKGGQCGCEDDKDCPTTSHVFGNKCITMGSSGIKRCGCNEAADCTGNAAGSVCTQAYNLCSCTEANDCTKSPYTQCTSHPGITDFFYCEKP